MTTTKTATGAVVDFIQSARIAEFPAEALSIGKRCIIDSLAVLLAGSTQDAGRILHEHVQGTRLRARPRPCSAREPFKTGLGLGRRSSTARAGHALDWDDTQLATSADRIFGLLTHPQRCRRSWRRSPSASAQRISRQAVPRGVPDGLRGRVQDRRGDPPESLQEGLPLVGHRSARSAPPSPRRSCSGSTPSRRRTCSRSPRARRPASA